jgi:hypothetical protein
MENMLKNYVVQQFSGKEEQAPLNSGFLARRNVYVEKQV